MWLTIEMRLEPPEMSSFGRDGGAEIQQALQGGPGLSANLQTPRHAPFFIARSHSMSEWMFKPMFVMLYMCSLATSHTISQIWRSP